VVQNDVHSGTLRRMSERDPVDKTLETTAKPAENPEVGTCEPVAVMAESADADKQQRRETGGPSGPEPTRYGDWERKGRCIDF